jgi:tRNA(fMet)-specific endonuclease VapC
MSAPRYLLDTNILIHFVRADQVWAQIRSRYQLLAADPKPLISIVSAGELRSFAYYHRWGDAKRNQMEYILGYFDEVPINSAAIVETYAVIDSHFQLQGHAPGKNDLWIAATAHVMGATLLTTDRDFDVMTPMFFTRDWVDPNTSAKP